ncbi:glycoside hydrolase superfamily [Epithele typhae]|uniref:glycoside hydrolase superfamily n=1 Tax=Epithele typhae TaxID=378194 RepID=UPI002007CD02|nr:glycoside hydrolase superfamily [Epithele typhae]KAH9927198.1 glycoside hydrolase superfamily [Epithele typhae]
MLAACASTSRLWDVVLFPLLLLLLLLACTGPVYAAVPVSQPSGGAPTPGNVVFSNFFGISLELSFINYYLGNDSSTVPAPVVQYLSALHAHGSGKPVRLRLGGNSMDSSTYVPGQADLIHFTDPDANANDQPIDFGAQLFDTMNAMSDAVGGAEYLVGLSLRTPNNTNIPLLAGDIQKAVGDKIDAFLLGNEPDLYSAHGQRPYLKNYTTDDYIDDYQTVFNALQNTPQGDVLSLNNIAGPTTCCFWDLAPVLQSGWLDKYKQQLKYITVQHYPQNTCTGKPSFGVEWYIVHANTVRLASWQTPGITMANAAGKPMIMDEFNSIACGGAQGVSNTFGVALWTADYALQLAAVGYKAAYIHTREPGITYNPFDPPHVPAAQAGAWLTQPPYYAMLPVAEALEGTDGARVVDLNLQNSKTVQTATAAGYAIYAGASAAIRTLVLFNYQNASGATADYAIDAALAAQAGSAAAGAVTVRYLAAASVNEATEIAYGGLTYAGVGDAHPVPATFAASRPDANMSCADGCTVQVPGPGMAVVFFGGPSTATAAANSSANATNSDAIYVGARNW